MFSDSIEQLKNQFTDKYVAVDATRPELARFRDLVGQVKTVNMSGRALVEFMDYHLSTGWYDIDLSCLKVVDKPLPQEKKAEARKPTEKPAAKASAPAAAAPAKPAASPASAGGSGKKMSVAEMMAAARANKPGGAAPAAKSEAPAAKKEAPAKSAAPAESAEAPATAEASAAETPKKIDRSKMSVADMLAAARKADKKE